MFFERAKSSGLAELPAIEGGTDAGDEGRHRPRPILCQAQLSDTHIFFLTPDSSMNATTPKVFSEQTNEAVVQMPGRRFPGSVIQGDSLATLCSEAKEIALHLKRIGCADEELLYLVQEHQQKLVGRLLGYQRVLGDHHIPLPYTTSWSEEDLVVLVNEDTAWQ